LEIRELSYIVVWYLKPWNPEILKWWSHILSLFRIQELLCIVVWYLKPRNPKIPKWWSHILSLFEIRELLCIVVWYLKPQNLKVVVRHPFTFQNSGVVVYGGLVFETMKSWNPKSWNAGPTFPFSTFRRFVCVVVWALSLTKYRSLNSWSTNHLLGVAICWWLTFVLTKIRTPKPDIGWAPYLFRNFEIQRLMSCNVLHRELVNPETKIVGPTPQSFFAFRIFFLSCVYAPCVCKSRNPKTKNIKEVDPTSWRSETEQWWKLTH